MLWRHTVSYLVFFSYSGCKYRSLGLMYSYVDEVLLAAAATSLEGGLGGADSKP